jgi:type IX secretion system substrate protein
MKKLLLILATLITLTAKSQTSVYFPFPDSTIVWRQEGKVEGFSCCCSGTLCLKEDHFQYFLNGDTLIGAFVYKKIYQTGNGVEHIVGPYNCPPWCTSNDQYYYYNNIYSGSFRQDTAQRKIFFIPPGFTQDTLLYDFNLNVGDTLPPSWTNYYPSNYVISIDSILVGGFYHKRFQLSSSAFPNEVAIIEGIGNSLGLLSPLYSNINVSNFYNMLLCVTVNSIPVYPDTSTVCNLASQINDVSYNLSFSIIPNPFSEKLNIKLNNFTTAEVVLYDITSRKILQQKFTNSVSLNTIELAKGIYLYEVRNKNGVIKKGKVVKD